MHRFNFLTLLASVIAAIAFAEIAPDVRSQDAPQVPKDRFRIVSTIEEAKMKDEIEDFTNYGHEKMVVIRNKAQEEFRISCKSDHDSPKQTSIRPGSVYIFTFRPQKNGNTKFWCTVEYKKFPSRFDVYNEALPYMCPRDNENVYQYSVTQQGIYVDPAKGNKGQKVRGLFSGQNKFILWEKFNTVSNEADGASFKGVVYSGKCLNIYNEFNDKAFAVTLCDYHCIYLYTAANCEGIVEIVQSTENNCVDFGMSPEMVQQASSVRGCPSESPVTKA